MENSVEQKDPGVVRESNPREIYKESIKRDLHAAIGKAIDEETERATREIAEERQKAINTLLDEYKLAIRQIIEEQKKEIRLKALEVKTSNAVDAEVINESIDRIYKSAAPVVVVPAMDVQTVPPEPPPVLTDEWVELEIRPPGDQEAIIAINAYLNALPAISISELFTLVDKSVIKLRLRHPLDVREKLALLPQVMSVEEKVVDERRKISVTLGVKSRLGKSHLEMNARVKNIYSTKNR